jgi:dCTP deaminase
MILSDNTLKQMISDKSLVCEPINELSMQPASIDCRIGNHFLLVDDTKHTNGVITFDEEIQYREIEAESIVMPAHSFLLATTIEYVKLPPNITAFVEGRSSIGRMGLFIQNAGWVDAGFEGQITLELYNANSLPIKIDAGRRVCQLVFCSMDKPADKPYQGKYQGQKLSVGSRIYQDK